MRCKELNSNIVYVHCYAHCLNLVLVDACTLDKGNRLIFDFLGLYNLFTHLSKGVVHGTQLLKKYLRKSVQH